MFLLKPPDLRYSVTVAQMARDTTATWIIETALHLVLSFCPALVPSDPHFPWHTGPRWSGSCPPPRPRLLPLLALNV